MTGAAAVWARVVVDPDQARREAERILADDRFRVRGRSGLRAPSALREWVGDVFEAVGRWLGNVTDVTPGGTLGFVVICAALAAAISILIGRGRASRAEIHAPRERQAHRAVGPRDLERAARAAEGSGNLDAALRLGFQAGLLRLQIAGLVQTQTQITNGAIARRLQQPEFEAVATTFDAVVYGGRHATNDDLEMSKAIWPKILVARAAVRGPGT